MDKDLLLDCIATIMYEEGYQTKKGRTIQSSLQKQKWAINKLAKALGIDNITLVEISEMSFG